MDPSLRFTTSKDTDIELPRPQRVKNKTPAPIQITAEQILREARDLQDSHVRQRPKQTINDSIEQQYYQLRTRTHFENLVRRNRNDVKIWINYARWEESQKNFDRARSVFRRALVVDYRNYSLRLKYAEFEMTNGFVNNARNVWDEAVALLPRVDQFWFKYIHMEEMLGNVSGARQIYERWMSWMPDTVAWLTYVKFELRHNETDRAREIYEKFVECHPGVGSWIRFVQFQTKNGEISKARECFERAVERLGEDHEEAEKLFVAFAEFEERCKEIDRARSIYKFGLDHIPKSKAEGLYEKYVAFEKQYGDKEGIKDAIVGRTRFQYEEEVRKNPFNYDAWFDYIHLEESTGNFDTIREIYERAIANVPPADEKRYWKRYIYLWINYAFYEELDAQDIERARNVYKECLKLIPHDKFSFSKIWILAAQLELRQKKS